MLNGNEIKQRLLELAEPVILIDEEIDRRMYKYVAASIIYLISRGSPSVKIIIDSPGGEITSGLDIYDLVRLYTGFTTCLVINRCNSIAAIILQACKKRLCAIHARILIHNVSRTNLTIDEMRDEEKYKKELHQLEKKQQLLDTILCQKTGKSLSEISVACAKDESMNAKEALAFGLIDEIV